MKVEYDPSVDPFVFERFGSLIDETIFTLGGVGRGSIDKKGVICGLLCCEILLEGYKASKRSCLSSWSEMNALKHYKHLEASENLLKAANLDVKSVIDNINGVKCFLEKCLEDETLDMDRSKLTQYQSFLLTISVPFLRATDLMYRNPH